MKWTKQVRDGIFDRWVVRARRGNLPMRNTEPVATTFKLQELSYCIQRIYGLMPSHASTIKRTATITNRPCIQKITPFDP